MGDWHGPIYPRYSTWKGPTLHLEDLYVKPEFRQHGVGKQLFDAVVKVAAEQNVGRMEWTVLEWNDPALNFYKNTTLPSTLSGIWER